MFRIRDISGGTLILRKLAVLSLVFVTLGLPVADFWRFLLLTLAVMVICFGQVRIQPARWALAIIVVLVAVTLDWFAPGPRIEEGHNVYLPGGAGAESFERELPGDVHAAMLEIFNRAYRDGRSSIGSVDWLTNPKFKKPGVLTRAFARSADGFWQRPKYSRIVESIQFSSQNQARLDIINLKAFNFYDRSRRRTYVPPNFDNSSPITRLAMPFFVMFEVGPSLIGGETCWRGNVLWERRAGAGQFAQLNNDHERCHRFSEGDLGKRIFYLAIAPKAPRYLAVHANFEQRLTLWLKLIIRSLAVILILVALIKIDYPRRLLLPLGAATSTLLTFLIYWPDLLYGFRTHDGGNDGLTHESFGFGISQAIARGDLQEALKGGEDVFFFMPGLRYVRALEDVLFGSTNFGVVLFTMFIPIFLFFVLRHFLPLRLSITFILLFMFIPIFERFGFAQFLYVREMWKGFPEPIGYGLFLGALALSAKLITGPTLAPPYSKTDQLIRDRTLARQDYFAVTACIGMAAAGAVALRPNLAIAAVLLLGMLSLWLAARRRWNDVVFLGIGFAPVLFMGFHNWHFAGHLVPLTSSALDPRNLVVPPSAYLAAANELLHLDWGGSNLSKVGRQLESWNSLTDSYRLPVILVAAWVLLRPGYDLALKGLALIAISMHAAFLFYEASGRKAHLAWLLVFVIFVVVLRQNFIPWLFARWGARFGNN